MLELKLIAVGSSPLIADEIKSIARSFLGEEISIVATTTNEIKMLAENIFCICAVTQAEKLSRVVPAEKLFVFDLRPTTKFFLDIARIPAGSEVYVFNNLLPYTKLLAEECRALGVDKISFHSIAYDEMPCAEVCARLKRARYIIGVDRLVGEYLSKTYSEFLLPDVKIIAGKRAASVSSASKLLAGIAKFYHDELSREENKSRESIKTGERIIRILKNASAKAVIGQIGGASHFASSPTEFLTDLDEQLSMLQYLREKFLRLCPQ